MVFGPVFLGDILLEAEDMAWVEHEVMKLRAEEFIIGFLGTHRDVDPERLRDDVEIGFWMLLMNIMKRIVPFCKLSEGLFDSPKVTMERRMDLDPFVFVLPILSLGSIPILPDLFLLLPLSLE